MGGLTSRRLSFLERCNFEKISMSSRIFLGFKKSSVQITKKIDVKNDKTENF